MLARETKSHPQAANLLSGYDNCLAGRSDNFADRATSIRQVVGSVDGLAKGVLLSQYTTPVYEPQAGLIEHQP